MIDKKSRIVYIVHGDSNMVFGVFENPNNAQTLLARLQAKWPNELFWYTPYDYDDDLVDYMELGSK